MILNQIKIKKKSRNINTKSKQYVELREHIKENGILNPIILDSNHFIIDGLCRYIACKELGIDKIPTIIPTED